MALYCTPQKLKRILARINMVYIIRRLKLAQTKVASLWPSKQASKANQTTSKLKKQSERKLLSCLHFIFSAFAKFRLLNHFQDRPCNTYLFNFCLVLIFRQK